MITYVTTPLPDIRSFPGKSTRGKRMRRIGTYLGSFALFLSAGSILFLHIISNEQRDLLQITLSDLVFTNQFGWIFSVGAIGVGVSGFGVLLSWVGTELLQNKLLFILLNMTSLAFLLVAIFPTDRPDAQPLTIAAQIHRYSAGLGFFCILLVAYLTVTVLQQQEQLPTRRIWLWRSTVLATVLLALFLMCHIAMAPLFLQEQRGVLQRILVITLLTILGQLLFLGRSLPIYLANRHFSPKSVSQALCSGRSIRNSSTPLHSFHYSRFHCCSGERFWEVTVDETEVPAHEIVREHQP